MADFFVILAACIGLAWLGLSTFLGVVSIEESALHAHLQRCTKCHHLHFLRGDGSLHRCE